MNIDIENNGRTINIRIWPWGKNPWSASITILKGLSYDAVPVVEPAIVNGNLSLRNITDELSVLQKSLEIAARLAIQLDVRITDKDDFKFEYQVVPDYLLGAKLSRINQED